MKTVCGQTQPQNNRPNAAVNKIMNTMNVIIVKPKMKKSCGQKIFPKMINFASGTLKRNNGLPLSLIKGNPKKTMKKNQLT
jgi:hypothetical protein